MSNSKALLPSTPISLLGITKLIKAIINTGSINLKANADCIEYVFSITQITLNISKASYLIYIANSNIRICTQSDLSAYSNSFDIAII